VLDLLKSSLLAGVAVGFPGGCASHGKSYPAETVEPARAVQHAADSCNPPCAFRYL